MPPIDPQAEAIARMRAVASKKKIYVASSWRNKLQPGIVNALRYLGAQVYDFRNPADGKGGFRWTAIDPNWEKWTPAQWREALKSQTAKDGFLNDWNGMHWANTCVLVLPCGRSAHLEAGFMAGEGKRVVTLALENVEPDLMNLLLGPAENICTTMDELFDALGLAMCENRGKGAARDASGATQG